MNITLKGIENIIFDLGGVILNIDYQRTIAAFTKLGLDDFKQMYSQYQQSGIFDKLETGHITAEEFRSALKECLPDATSDADIDHAWNAMLLDLPPQRLELLKKLKGNYRIFLLSNTNKIHFDCFTHKINSENGISGLSSFFEKDYYSFQIGLRKPDREIFEFVLDEKKLNPEKTLFIDDSHQHIEGAKIVGINAFHLKEMNIIKAINQFEEINK